MLGDFACRVALQVLGYLYPAYKTFKVVQLPATRSNDTLLRNWCQYWALMAVFTAVQPVADTFCFWLPLYYEAKLALAVYLWANDLAGAQHVWARWFHPLVSRYEPVVDRRLGESKAFAREWLHSNSMRLLALAQAKALAWLAQVQAQAQQAAGRVASGGSPGEAAAAASAGAPAEATGAAPRRSARAAAAAKRGGRGGRRAADESEDEFEAEEETENAVDANAGRRGSGVDKKAAVPAVPDEPLLGSVFSSRFSLASFYSARSSDLQTQDVQAGLKGFPILVDKKDNKDE
ncbi:hypothetical protein ABPG75_013597 [Micractinium tetrahymenae]